MGRRVRDLGLFAVALLIGSAVAAADHGAPGDDARAAIAELGARLRAMEVAERAYVREPDEAAQTAIAHAIARARRDIAELTARADRDVGAIDRAAWDALRADVAAWEALDDRVLAMTGADRDEARSLAAAHSTAWQRRVAQLARRRY